MTAEQTQFSKEREKNYIENCRYNCQEGWALNQKYRIFCSIEFCIQIIQWHVFCWFTSFASIETRDCKYLSGTGFNLLIQGKTDQDA